MSILPTSMDWSTRSDEAPRLARLRRGSRQATAPAHRATRLSIGVVIPELAKYGGAERFLIECVARWQLANDITIYASKINRELLAEHGIGRQVKQVVISPYFEGQHSILLNAALLPKIWQQEIGKHDVYHAHLWPTHLVDLHPLVWYPHEPLRLLHDLRYEQPLEEAAARRQRDLHLYPKYSYDRISDVAYQAYLTSMDLVDRLGKPDRVVANSRYSAGYLEGVYGAPVRDVVYPGVDVDDFIVQPSDENIFLCVGQLWPHKRTKLVIEALKSVEDAQLYVVGSGPEKERLARVAAGLGLENRVFFLHGLSNLEVKILFSRALAVVFVPVKEPFGIVALEAMAAGKPLIAVDEGGFTEAVNEQCALLVPPEPEAIAEQMRYLRDNKPIARQMGAAGREQVRAFGWDRAARELIAIIEETHDTWSRSQAAPRPRAAAKATLFGAQYYCWYGDGMGAAHWNDTPHAGGVTDMPRLGYYASSSASAIEAHLKMFDQMGLDFVLLNLHVDRQGMNAYEEAAADTIFSVIERAGSALRVGIQLCPYDCTREHASAAIEAIRRRFVPRPNYFHYDGEPVLFLFWTGVSDGNRAWINFLDDETHDFVRIASSLRLFDARDERRQTFGLFHGWSLYSPLELSSSENWQPVWHQAAANSAAGTRNLKVACVSPGYDDRHLRDPNRNANPYRHVDRKQGGAYRQMIDFALGLEETPDLVVISTFNEYHENTHIEPSRNHGSLYLDLTRDFIAKGRQRWSRS